jgi:hypothetical protein
MMDARIRCNQPKQLEQQQQEQRKECHTTKKEEHLIGRAINGLSGMPTTTSPSSDWFMILIAGPAVLGLHDFRAFCLAYAGQLVIPRGSHTSDS